MFDYEAITAKCRCMQGELLSADEYRELAEKANVAEAAVYLREHTVYSRVTESMEIPRMRRGMLEQAIARDFFDTIMKLYVFASGRDRTFMGMIAEDTALHSLLEALRTLGSDDGVRYSAVPDFVVGRTKLDFSRIIQCSDPASVASVLVGTPYHAILLNHIGADGKIDDFTSLEVALYNDYYKRLWASSSVFSARDAVALRELIETRADIINLSRLGRLRMFEVGAEEAQNYLIPLSHKLDRKGIGKLLSSSPEEFEKTRTALCGGKNPAELVFALAHRTLSSSPPSILIPYALLLLKQTETENIIHIIEGIRYSMPPYRIMENVVTV